MVIATWIAIILTYRSRPIKLEIQKKHSDDLKDIIHDWKSQIPSPERALNLIVNEPQVIEILVEKEYLFSDLRNHMPSELRLFDVWETYKEALFQYNNRRYTLFQNIKNEALNRTGLPIGEGSEPRVLRIDFCKQIYTNVFYTAEGRKKAYTDSDYRSHAINNNAIQLVCDNQSIAHINSELLDEIKGIHQNWMDELNSESIYVEEARNLISLKNQLDSSKMQLERELKEYKRIPILPKNCKYIGWARSGFLDTIKGKIKQLLKKISDC